MEAIISLIYMLLVVLMIAGMWKVYVKLGLPGWACLIPIYNIYALMELFKWETMKLIFFFIPIVNIYFAYLLWKEVAVRFGKDGTYAIGLLLLPFVFFPLLGFKEEVKA